MSEKKGMSKKQLKKLEREAKRREFQRQQAKLEFDRELQCIRIAERDMKKKVKDLTLQESRPLFKDLMIERRNTFSQAMDRKDWLIGEMQNQIDGMQSLQRKQYQDYALLVGQQMTQFIDKIETLRHDYKQDVETLLQSKDMYMARKRQYIGHQEDYGKTTLHCLKIAMDEYMKQKGGECMSRIDEEHNKNKGDLNELVATLEQRLSGTMAMYQQEIGSYLEKTTKRLKLVTVLQERDHKNRKLIEEQFMKLEYLHRKVGDMNDYLRSSAADPRTGTDLVQLRTEKDKLYNVYRRVKAILKEKTEAHNDRLRTLVMRSNEAIRRLRAVRDKGACLIEWRIVCWRLETADEHRRDRTLTRPDLQYTGAPILDKMIGFYEQAGRARLSAKYLAYERRRLRRSIDVCRAKFDTVGGQRHRKLQSLAADASGRQSRAHSGQQGRSHLRSVQFS